MGFSSKFDQHVDIETFDADKAAQKLAPTSGLPIRPGEYGIIIEECEDLPSKRGGEYRKMTMKILAPAQQGRTIYQIFPFDCGNDSAEETAIDQIMAIWVACGGDPETPPSAEDMTEKKFVGITSLEFNDYKDGSYQPLVAGVEMDRKTKPSGEFEDEKLPQVWFEAVEFYENGGGKKKSKPKSKSFDDEDLPF